jgi:hypothetical protein
MKPLRKPKKLTAKQRALNESWQAIMDKYKTVPVVPVTPSQQNFYRRETPYVPSLNSTVVDNCAKKDIAVYTGTNMIGIGQLHKSNAVPVFNTEEAENIAKMRR